MTKIKYKSIGKLAEKLKTYVEKNHKLPKSLTVDKVEYTYPQIGYILAKSVNNPGKDITVIKVGAAPNPTGDTVKFDVSKEDYKKLAKNYTNFIEKKENRKLPNFSNYKNKKIKQRVMIYSLAKIVVWYDNHKKTLPNTCKFYTSQTVAPKTNSSSKSTAKTTNTNCQNPYTSKPHYTDSGCNKLGQCTPYYCGPHSIHQGFRKFGVTNISEATLAGWAGTTTSGTDHDGLNTSIKKAAKKAGFDVDIKWYNFSDLGKTTAERFKKFASMICKSNVFGFFHIGYQCSGECSSGTVFGHYEMADKVDIKNEKVRVLNSLGSNCGGNSYCGHLQWRSFALQAHFISNISQKSVCIVTKK